MKFPIQLSATGGYDSYIWDNISTTDSVFSVSSVGSHTVTVENMCGIKTDSVQVYEECDFPIYFPTAFTPNGDYLNDILRVPAVNRNKLVLLRIYNRWGHLVFSSNKPGNGWDGNYKSSPQPSGKYVYILEMQDLSGHMLNQKGTVVLIR